MGIDAEMRVKIDNYDINLLKEHSYKLGCAFREDLFLAGKKEFYNHPLEVDEDPYHYIYKMLDKKESETILKIAIGSRYYGIGYERGPICNYIKIAEFLEKLIPNCKIYYFGDSGGADDPLLFTKDERDKLFNHFVKYQNNLYYKSWTGNGDEPICPHCEYKTWQSGSGGNYAHYVCNGCGWQLTCRGDKVKSGFDVPLFWDGTDE